MPYEIELDDGTILEVEDGVDPDTAEKDYLRQVRIADLTAKNPGEYDPNSPEFKRKYTAAAQEKIRTQIADPKTGMDLADLPVDQRSRFFNESAQYLGVRDKQGRPLKDLTPQQQKEFWAGIDRSTSTKMDLDNVRAGIGSGMLRGWKGAVNLALPDSLTPEWASDENIQEMDKRDADLPGSAKLIGNLAGTAPVSAGIGAAQRGLTALSTASKAPAVLSRALGSAPARAALEGGTYGAIFADPDEQGQGALVGASLGYGLDRLGALGGRVLRGAVKKNQATKELEQLAQQHGDDIFVPLSQAASDDDIVSRLAKSTYREALPIVPGTSGKLTRQAEAAQSKLRELALREALPEGMSLPAKAGEKVDDAVAALKTQFDKAYDDTVKSYVFNVPQDLRQRVGSAIKAAAGPKTKVNSTTVNQITDDVEKLIRQFSDGKKTIDGTNLLNVKREIGDLINTAKGHEIPSLRAAESVIDDIIVQDLKQGGSKQNLADLKRYLELTPAYRAFEPVKRAAGKAAEKEGQFTFRMLARSARNSPEQRVIGRLGAATVDKSPIPGGYAGKVLARMGAGGAAVGAVFDPVTTAIVLGSGQALASKSMQKALLGSTAMQKRLAQLLRNHPDAARRIGSGLRASTVIEATNNE